MLRSISTHKQAESFSIFIGLFLALLIVPSSPAQEVVDTIKVRTRVVFMDALSGRKRRHSHQRSKAGEFWVFDDGATHHYHFTRRPARKPLAMIRLDCRDDGAADFSRPK